MLRGDALPDITPVEVEELYLTKVVTEETLDEFLLGDDELEGITQEDVNWYLMMKVMPWD